MQCFDQNSKLSFYIQFFFRCVSIYLERERERGVPWKVGLLKDRSGTGGRDLSTSPEDRSDKKETRLVSFFRFFEEDNRAFTQLLGVDTQAPISRHRGQIAAAAATLLINQKSPSPTDHRFQSQKSSYREKKA